MLKLAVPTFLVVGAGPTGIGAAVRLTELGIDHLVVESGDQLGGMATSITDSDGFTWDLGGHVLHSHFAEFDDAVAAAGHAKAQAYAEWAVRETGMGVTLHEIDALAMLDRDLERRFDRRLQIR